MSSAVSAVLQEVYEERLRQDSLWGEQNHPSIAPALGVVSAAQHYGVPLADEAKALTDRRATTARLTFADILVEELSEAIEAAVESEERLREELIQVAAVAVSWVEAIDRRAA